MHSPHPLIIGFSGISGAGKSTLIQSLSKPLQATSIYWDDFDAISQGPSDYIKWYKTSKNYDEWIYDALASTLAKLKSGEIVTCPATGRQLNPTPYILFDAPLGYCHKATAQYIDYLICIDIPLDIALARRLIRDQERNPKTADQILAELKEYLENSRPLFILPQEERKCDLLIDGSSSIEEQQNRVLMALKRLKSKVVEKFSIKLCPLSEWLNQQIHDGFRRHAISVVGHDEKLDPVAFVANDEKGSFIGAVVVCLFWGALHIKKVFIEDSYRNLGIATQLMEQAFAYGRDNQCPFAFVETMNFQALAFYRKLGFALDFTRSGYKYNTAFHYLSKNL